MSNILECIQKQLLSRPYATAESHRVGGIGSRQNKREMGHMRGDRLVEFLKLVIMATGMVFFMTLFMTLLREGLTLDFHILWINQFLFALVIVFPIALGMSQIAKKVVFRIMRQKGQVVLP